MFISASFNFRKSKEGIYYLNNVEITSAVKAHEREFDDFYRAMRNEADRTRTSFVNDEEMFSRRYPNVAKVFYPEIGMTKEELVETLTDERKKERAINGIKGLMDFFKEFDFEPNFRFVNTLAINLKINRQSATQYVTNYFELIDSPYCNEIKAKITSKEFEKILLDISLVEPTKVVNHRFRLYYGSQGTGKTTIAMTESGSKPIVCNSSMLPSDLMEDFVFVDGKATYKPSDFWRAMTDGRTIVMDEINLLPYDTLRFLQGLLDNKSAITYKGNVIEISENFSIIGTMNLTVNGMTYGLPEPLVDRCAVTKKFTLSADDLFSALV